MFLTIEGTHAFGKALPLPDIQAGRTNKHATKNANVSKAAPSCENIMNLRTGYDIPVFSVGLFHHFWNGLAGHARSLAGPLEAVVNQQEALNGPLLDAGEVVIDELNKVDYNGKKVKKIVVDIKHMSPQCRKDYHAYRRNKASLRKNRVFCSHTGINMCFETQSMN